MFLMADHMTWHHFKVSFQCHSISFNPEIYKSFLFPYVPLPPLLNSDDHTCSTPIHRNNSRIYRVSENSNPSFHYPQSHLLQSSGWSSVPSDLLACTNFSSDFIYQFLDQHHFLHFFFVDCSANISGAFVCEHTKKSLFIFCDYVGSRQTLGVSVGSLHLFYCVCFLMFFFQCTLVF